MSAKQSIHIEAPVKKVFDFCADPRASWSVGSGQMAERTELIDVKVTEEGVGTYYSWAVTIAGLRLDGFDVYSEFVPNKRITDRSSWHLAGTWTYTFEPEGSGTRLTMERHPGSFWALPPVDWLVDRLFVAPNSRRTLENVKEALESPSSASSAAA